MKLTAEQIAAIEATGRTRLERVHNVDTSTKRSLEGRKSMGAQVEFFCGAMASLAALGYELPAKWGIFLASGRSVITPMGVLSPEEQNRREIGQKAGEFFHD